MLLRKHGFGVAPSLRKCHEVVLRYKRQGSRAETVLSKRQQGKSEAWET
jgi:hypothetical protein